MTKPTALSSWLKAPLRSLKTQLLICFVGVVLLCAGLFAVLNQAATNRALIQTVGDNQHLIISNKAATVDQRLLEIDNMLNWLCLNDDLRILLGRSAEQTLLFDDVKKRFYRDLDSLQRSVPSAEYISSLYLLGANGLEVRKGPQGYLVDTDAYGEDAWYQKALSSHGETLLFPAMYNYTHLPTERPYPSLEHVVPIFKYIRNIDQQDALAQINMLVSSDIFFDLSGEDILFGETSYLLDPNGQILLSTDTAQLAAPFDPDTFAQLLALDASYFQMGSGDDGQFIVYKKLEKKPYYYVKTFPLQQLRKLGPQGAGMGALTITLAAFFALLLSIVLTNGFTKPIQELTQKTAEIAHGNFAPAKAKRRRNELGLLDANLDKMAGDLQALMQSAVQREAEKKHLHIRMLQGQVGPHFLFNTLSSIKWMAQLQGSDGIYDMVSSLAELLRVALYNSDETISMGEELRLLENYVTIQNIRYHGKIEFSIAPVDEQILSLSIPKFTLQPIAENAIFHGLEPKPGTGTISVSFSQDGDALRISICDNGVGIPPEKLACLLDSPDASASEEKRGGIGMANVHQRIRLLYGEGFGLHVESQPMQYTCVTVRIPQEPFMEAKNEHTARG